MLFDFEYVLIFFLFYFMVVHHISFFFPDTFFYCFTPVFQSFSKLFIFQYVSNCSTQKSTSAPATEKMSFQVQSVSRNWPALDFELF